MRKATKRILLCSTIVLAMLAVAYCVLRFGYSMDVLDRSGWKTEDGAVRYLDYWGRPQTGWKLIEEDYYFFAEEDGKMVTGWYSVAGVRYYFNEDGTRASGWLEDGGNRYYLSEEGIPTVGWTKIADDTYYFAPDGAMAEGWVQLNGNNYYFMPDSGTMHVGWLELDDARYYCSTDGSTVSGWVELDGIRYQFREDGSVVTGWFEDDTRYFFGDDGKPQSGWLEWEQKTYYLNEDGSVTTGWLEQEDARYYFLSTGRMAIGEVEVDGVSRFFSSSGKETLMCNPWHPIPEDFELDLVTLNGKKVDRDTKEPLEQMIQAARKDGVKIGINNIYRSHATQTSLWNTRVKQYMEDGMTKAQAEAKTGESVAIPGHSEHETGLALDVNSGTKVYKWLGENCWDYGFILRYPDDRIDITGIIYEPWHFRYVGTELSLELRELGLCMEEYFDMLTEQQKNIPD